MNTETQEAVSSNGTKEQGMEGTLQTNGEEKEFPELRKGPIASPWAENPFVFMRRFAEDMERFFEDFGSFRIKPLFRREVMPRLSEFGRTVWTPEVEFFERDGQFTVRADLPGLTKDDVKVEITDHELTLSGERRDEQEEKGEGFYRSERSYGSFYRRIPLPEGVKAEDATATFRNGVLEVVMQAPKRELRGRQLEITEATEKVETKAAAG